MDSPTVSGELVRHIPLDQLRNSAIRPFPEFPGSDACLLTVDFAELHFNSTSVGKGSFLLTSNSFAWSDGSFSFIVSLKDTNGHSIAKGNFHVSLLLQLSILTRQPLQQLDSKHFLVHLNLDQEQDFSEYVISEIHLVIEEEQRNINPSFLDCSDPPSLPPISTRALSYLLSGDQSPRR